LDGASADSRMRIDVSPSWMVFGSPRLWQRYPATASWRRKTGEPAVPATVMGDVDVSDRVPDSCAAPGGGADALLAEPPAEAARALDRVQAKNHYARAIG
jgi:hypothetical protein